MPPGSGHRLIASFWQRWRPAAYARRSLLDTGVPILGGSDFPVESPNPFLGIYASVTRQKPGGRLPGGWSPEQRMTRQEAILSYTRWAAYGAFEEGVRGRIAPGCSADLILLPDDPFQAELEQLTAIRPLLTIVAAFPLNERVSQLRPVRYLGDKAARVIMPSGAQDIGEVYSLRTLRPKGEIAARLAAVIGSARRTSSASDAVIEDPRSRETESCADTLYEAVRLWKFVELIHDNPIHEAEDAGLAPLRRIAQ